MDALTKIALVGTSRHPGPLPPEDASPAAALVDGLPECEPEAALLLRSGLEAIYRQAGRRAVANVEAPAPSPAEIRRCGSREVAGMLAAALAPGGRELLVEFFRQMREADVVVPHDLLPQMLDVREATLREHLLPVLGERGRWLARQNPEWSWVEESAQALSNEPPDPAQLERDWDEGRIDQRARALAALRQSDPPRGRELLKSSLATDKAEHRARLLQQLVVGLSLEDEPLLEGCLADRSAAVRQTAIGLLATLPASALAGRMRARGEELLSGEQKGWLAGRLKLACTPPEQLPESWQRDGVSSKPPAGAGKRAFWTETVLAAVPPSHWTRRFETTPAALVAAICEDKFAGAVISGWTTAAVQFAAFDPESDAWLAALWDHWLETLSGARGKRRTAVVAALRDLLQTMPRREAETALLGLLVIRKAAAHGDALVLLGELPRPWSATFGQEYLARVREVLRRTNDERASQWAATLATAAGALPSEAFPAALAPWELADEGPRARWHIAAARREVDRFRETVHTRMQFLEALAR